MPSILQHRRGNTSFVAANTPASGELLVNTDNNTIVVGDGVTSGGWLVGSNTFNTLTTNTAFIGSLYFSNNIVTPANTGAYGLTTQPVVVNGDLQVLGSSNINGYTPTNSTVFTAVVNRRYLLINAVIGSPTMYITLPKNPNAGDSVEFVAYGGGPGNGTQIYINNSGSNYIKLPNFAFGQTWTNTDYQIVKFVFNSNLRNIIGSQYL